MSTLRKIIDWVYSYEMKLGNKPKVIPITPPEMMEIMSDFSPLVRTCDYTNNRKNQIYGIDVEESPWAEMTRQRVLDIGVERLSMQSRIDGDQFSMSQQKYNFTGRLIQTLTAEILADVTHLDVSFDWDRLAWLKRKVKWISSRWPVKRKTVRLEGKVLYPYLKIQAPADTHRVRFLVRP